MRPIKVLFEHPSASLYDPVLSVFAEIARGLDPARFEVHFAVARHADGELKPAGGQARVTRWAIGSGAPHGRGAARPAQVAAAARSGRAAAGLARYMREQRIDLIHCDGTPSGGAVALAASRLAGTPLLVHLHELVGRYAGGAPHSPARRRMERVLIRRADRLVAVSAYIAEQARLEGVARRPVRVVPNGVDIERFRPDLGASGIRHEYGIGADEPLALQLGRVLASKRQEDFIRGLAIARRSVPELRGLVIGWDDPGEPPGKAELRRLAEQEGLGGGLVLAEGRPDAPQLMAASDIVVNPGLNEASGLVVLEAMASGRPVIAARSGGTPELVADRETGFLVPPQEPAALGEKLVALASDRELRQRMGAAARERAVSEFDGRLLAERFAPIYAELAGAGSGW
jgi:D-inositol-3-phosphate glycosyltransferase